MKLPTFVVLLALVPALCVAEKIAITFDDLPLNGRLPAGVTEVDIVKRVLPIFAGRGLPPMYGFLNARKLESNPAGAGALKLWVAGGQRVANHTYSHIDLTRSLSTIATQTEQGTRSDIHVSCTRQPKQDH